MANTKLDYKSDLWKNVKVVMWHNKCYPQFFLKKFGIADMHSFYRIFHYETISYAKLKIIAEACHCSVTYLITGGLSDGEDYSDIKEAVRNVLKAHGKTFADLSREIGYKADSTLGALFRDNRIRFYLLRKIASILGVSVEYIVSGGTCYSSYEEAKNAEYIYRKRNESWL